MKRFLDQFADKVTHFIGSWYFIGLFFICLFSWIGLQTFIKIDPFPFTLLNLVLSTFAAVQGAVIMISQKKQEGKDRFLLMEIHRLVTKCDEFIKTIDKQNQK